MNERTIENSVSAEAAIGYKVYIAGPMSGYHNFNFPAFMEVAQGLRQEGYTVFNPAEKDLVDHPDIENNPEGSVAEAEKKDGFSLRKALDWDTSRICESDAIFMLPGWEKSQGAFAEWALAKALGLKIIYG